MWMVTSGHRIQELAVVADHEHGAFVAFEPGFQPDQCIQVQVVGGFVEQQQVARAHQCARQLQAHAPATRKTVDRVVQLVHAKAQTQYQGLRAGGRVVGAGVVQRHVGVGHALTVVALFRSGHFLLGSEQGHVTFDHELGCGHVGLGHVLRHLGHAPLRRHVKVALVFVQRLVQQAEQAGFAGAVAADETDFFAWVDGAEAPSSRTFVPRRRTRFFNVIMGGALAGKPLPKGNRT